MISCTNRQRDKKAEGIQNLHLKSEDQEVTAYLWRLFSFLIHFVFSALPRRSLSVVFACNFSTEFRYNLHMRRNSETKKILKITEP